jgi:hypothetical protein
MKLLATLYSHIACKGTLSSCWCKVPDEISLYIAVWDIGFHHMQCCNANVSTSQLGTQLYERRRNPFPYLKLCFTVEI